MAYQVRIIHFGQQGFPGPAVYFMRRFGEIVSIPFFFWLVQGEGITLLVDVGASAEQANEQNRETVERFGGQCAWRIPPEKEPAAQLAALGISPEDVQTIILTHLHADHSLNVSAFPKARLVMARRAWEAVTVPAHPALISPGVFPTEVLNLLQRELHKRFRLVEDGEEVAPGIRCYRLGGHSPDLTAVTVETSAGEVIIASDGAMFYDSLEMGCPSAGYNLVESLQALDWIRQRDGIVLPGHDWKVLERHPGGVIG
ncbi:MAG: N-acyl homoserine lactonase family protein [Nitrospinota bacterium]